MAAEKKSSFVEYLGSAHLGYTNIALYNTGAVRVENVVNGKCLSVKKFQTVEDAREWFDAFDGRNTERLAAAIRSMGVNV